MCTFFICTVFWKNFNQRFKDCSFASLQSQTKLAVTKIDRREIGGCTVVPINVSVAPQSPKLDENLIYVRRKNDRLRFVNM